MSPLLFSFGVEAAHRSGMTHGGCVGLLYFMTTTPPLPRRSSVGAASCEVGSTPSGFARRGFSFVRIWLFGLSVELFAVFAFFFCVATAFPSAGMPKLISFN